MSEQGDPLGSIGLERGGAAAVLPGFVNAHSHAFHRALRGASETRAGDFWTWREQMYAVAGRLDPESYRELATLVYAEMLFAGWTCVGEFHYLHHAPGGRPYADRNEMTWALVDAAATAGIRLTLLDACYLQAGVEGAPLEGVQRRFGDGDGEGWSHRAEEALSSGRFARTGEPGLARFGVAIHSVRAVGRPAMQTVAAFAAFEETPLHVHLSEQRRENEAALAAHQMTPTELLAAAGALTAHTTAVHATHLAARDVTAIGFARCGVCACPTTERDLGDGVGPFAELADSGAVLSVGSDSQAVIDPFEEVRSLEWHQRLATERRGLTPVAALLSAGSAGGARALGWRAEELAGDRVTVALDRSPGLAGPPGLAGEELAARILYGGAPADIERVTVGGEVVVDGGEHVRLGSRAEVAARLSAVLGSVQAER